MIAPTLLLSLALHATPAAAPLAAAGGQKGPAEKEVAELKKQRDLADAFVRRLAELALKDDKVDKEKRAELRKQLEQKRFFGSGTTAEELAEFRRQLEEADRAKIKLNDQALQELLRATALDRLDDKALRKAEEAFRRENGDVSAEVLRRAVAAEFRARIVRELRAKKK
jgi:hypothetical protein